jgi:fructose-1,6-bisphosphatase/sedoheptulose 1,7-bisphosphatase-like protein
MKAGDSLATIAGANKDALIAALVAYENKEITDAQTAGKITADRATKMKANVTARVTEQVNNPRPPRGPHGPKGEPAGAGLTMRS